MMVFQILSDGGIKDQSFQKITLLGPEHFLSKIQACSWLTNSSGGNPYFQGSLHAAALPATILHSSGLLDTSILGHLLTGSRVIVYGEMAPNTHNADDDLLSYCSVFISVILLSSRKYQPAINIFNPAHLQKQT